MMEVEGLVEDDEMMAILQGKGYAMDMVAYCKKMIPECRSFFNKWRAISGVDVDSTGNNFATSLEYRLCYLDQNADVRFRSLLLRLLDEVEDDIKAGIYPLPHCRIVIKVEVGLRLMSYSSTNVVGSCSGREYQWPGGTF